MLCIAQYVSVPVAGMDHINFRENLQYILTIRQSGGENRQYRRSGMQSQQGKTGCCAGRTIKEVNKNSIVHSHVLVNQKIDGCSIFQVAHHRSHGIFLIQ